MKSNSKILVVEDDADTARIMTELLKSAGCQVWVAAHGRQGLELALEEKFDLISLDAALPDLDGLVICRELKQRHLSHRTPIVFVSGRKNPEYQQRAYVLGAVDYIEKPFQAPDFIARIASAIDESLKDTGDGKMGGS